MNYGQWFLFYQIRHYLASFKVGLATVLLNFIMQLPTISFLCVNIRRMFWRKVWPFIMLLFPKKKKMSFVQWHKRKGFAEKLLLWERIFLGSHAWPKWQDAGKLYWLTEKLFLRWVWDTFMRDLHIFPWSGLWIEPSTLDHSCWPVVGKVYWTNFSAGASVIWWFPRR